MSDLYLIDKDHPWLGRHAYDKATLERFLHHGLLIPVTIDYEAAAEAMWNESAFSDNQTWTDAPLEYRSKYRGLAAICIAAAVKGDNDE